MHNHNVYLFIRLINFNRIYFAITKYFFWMLHLTFSIPSSSFSTSCHTCLAYLSLAWICYLTIIYIHILQIFQKISDVIKKIMVVFGGVRPPPLPLAVLIKLPQFIGENNRSVPILKTFLIPPKLLIVCTQGQLDSLYFTTLDRGRTHKLK